MHQPVDQPTARAHPPTNPSPAVNHQLTNQLLNQPFNPLPNNQPTKQPLNQLLNPSTPSPFPEIGSLASDICQHGRRAQRHCLASCDVCHVAKEIASELIGAQGGLTSLAQLTWWPIPKMPRVTPQCYAWPRVTPRASLTRGSPSVWDCATGQLLFGTRCRLCKFDEFAICEGLPFGRNLGGTIPMAPKPQPIANCWL